MRRKKYDRGIDYYQLEPGEVYECILSGSIKQFPHNYVSMETAPKLMRYVFLERKKYTREQICNITSEEMINEHLRSLKKHISFFYELISVSFPEYDIKPWELKAVPNNFWHKKDNRKDYMYWLCDKYDIDYKSKYDLRLITAVLLDENYGSRVIRNTGGIYNLIMEFSGTNFTEWEVCKINSWTKDLKNQAVIWLLESKLNFTKSEIVLWNESDIRKYLKVSIFREYNLEGMLAKAFNHSPRLVVKYYLEIK